MTRFYNEIRSTFDSLTSVDVIENYYVLLFLVFVRVVQFERAGLVAVYIF